MENISNGALILMLVLLVVFFVVMFVYDTRTIKKLKKDVADGNTNAREAIDGYKKINTSLTVSLKNSEEAHDLSTTKLMRLRDEHNELTEKHRLLSTINKDNLKRIEDIDYVSKERFKDLERQNEVCRDLRLSLKEVHAEKNHARDERDEALRNYKKVEVALKKAIEEGNKVVSANASGAKELNRLNKENLELKEKMSNYISLVNSNNSARRYVKGMGYDGDSMAKIVKDLVAKVKYGKK